MNDRNPSNMIYTFTAVNLVLCAALTLIMYLVPPFDSPPDITKIPQPIGNKK